MARGSKSVWTLADTYCTPTAAHIGLPLTDLLTGFIAPHTCSRSVRIRRPRTPGQCAIGSSHREFHDYFVTHLPSSSLHPDSRSGPSHRLPRKDSTPHVPADGRPPAIHSSAIGLSRETTVVRIPLKSAKHHYGSAVSRGTRPYNEDAHQAGVIDLPAFAKRPPISLTSASRRAQASGEGTSAQGASGDPQVFYFGVFDGHGGAECSGFLRERLHDYIEDASNQFELQSSLQKRDSESAHTAVPGREPDEETSQKALDAVDTTAGDENETDDGSDGTGGQPNASYPGDPPLIQEANEDKIKRLEKSLVNSWKELVGGYFRRFKPAYFSLFKGYKALAEESDALRNSGKGVNSGAAIEEVMTYAFLKADLDFVSAQATKEDEDRHSERAINDNDILGKTSKRKDQTGETKRFKGGSTCSVALVSTPSPAPFWNPSSPSSMLVAHVGDTRIVICSTATGMAIPLTTNHHPSSPVESNRLRRYAATFVTDSFGEERMSGLANTRSFGDIASKRIGVSAEPEIKRIELGAAEYSFLVLMSDGISGTLNDQEIVDIVKEAKTPEQAARDVVSFATEVSTEGDNATCLVVRMGGWERRQEGGVGSLGTKESRDWKREGAADPRNRRT